MERLQEKEVSPDEAKLKSILDNHKRQSAIFEFEESTIGSFFQEICGFVFNEPDIPLTEILSSSCGHIFQNGDLIYRCAYTDLVAFYLIVIEIAHMIQPAFFVLDVFWIVIISIIRYLSALAKELVAVVIVVKMNLGRTV